MCMCWSTKCSTAFFLLPDSRIVCARVTRDIENRDVWPSNERHSPAENVTGRQNQAEDMTIYNVEPEQHADELGRPAPTMGLGFQQQDQAPTVTSVYSRISNPAGYTRVPGHNSSNWVRAGYKCTRAQLFQPGQSRVQVYQGTTLPTGSEPGTSVPGHNSSNRV